MKKSFVLPAVPNTKMSEAEKNELFAKIASFEEEREKERSKPNPYQIHKSKFFADYNTAIRLQDLILHLYNSENTCDLGGLLANADVEHRELAIELIRRYSILGENDRDFLETAGLIIRSRRS